jgi:DNA-binding transcriptional ArsR family regulator
MSDSTPIAAAPEATTLLDLPTVFAAVCEPSRHALLIALADGAPHSVKELATRFNRSLASVSKHLIILREAHLVRAVTPPDADGRKQFYELPALFRSRDAAGKPLLDFGQVILRVG